MKYVRQISVNNLKVNVTSYSIKLNHYSAIQKGFIVHFKLGHYLAAYFLRDNSN